MNIQTTKKLPTTFWIISIVALLWNLMGVFQYLATVYMSDVDFAKLPDAQQKLMEAIPGWVTGAFAIAVFTGAWGCIGLLFRKKWATPIFILSLLAVLAQQVYNFLIAKVHIELGAQTVAVSLLVIIVSIILVWLSKKWTEKGWLT